MGILIMRSLPIAHGGIGFIITDVIGRSGKVWRQFHVSLAFKYEVDFSHVFVVMSTTIFRNIDQVNGGRSIFGYIEGSARLTTGAGYWVYLLELCDKKVLPPQFGRSL